MFQLTAAALGVSVALQPVARFDELMAPEKLAEQERVVQMIAAADKPVASENMVLLMRAGKPVIFEPAIVTELARMGRWNEAPLVTMIRQHQFAFVITADNLVGGGPLRTPEVDRAIRMAYPRVEHAAPYVWLNLPAQ
jgi:hypothetical protein